ncbi:hypothetical protein KIPB_012945, partial [Kipferlia bialata]|eukprot:g12945.t1
MYPHHIQFSWAGVTSWTDYFRRKRELKQKIITSATIVAPTPSRSPLSPTTSPADSERDRERVGEEEEREREKIVAEFMREEERGSGGQGERERDSATDTENDRMGVFRVHADTDYDEIILHKDMWTGHLQFSYFYDIHYKYE